MAISYLAMQDDGNPSPLTKGYVGNTALWNSQVVRDLHVAAQQITTVYLMIIASPMVLAIVYY